MSYKDSLSVKSRHQSSYKRRETSPPVRRIHDITPYKPTTNVVEFNSASLMPPTSTLADTAVVRPKPTRSKNGVVLVVMAVILFISGLGVAVWQIRINKQVEAQVSKSSQQDDSSTPDEVEPDPNSLQSYKVPAAQPRFISVPSLSVFARVRKVGIDSKSQLVAPGNIYDAGWYEDSSKPGDDGGAILIDGHVQGPTKPGIFSNLKLLKTGDTINLESGAGEKYNFKVVKTQTYKTSDVDMAAALVPAVPGKLGLNLITCAGKFDSVANDYKQRLIIFAIKQ